ncbi:MAG: MFS transporter [Anaerolineae bacterium]|nr:MFS transporter [Anaerolineae bacterium]MCX8066533.1 MFS transporter [Anaerolineae bacterium]MDW7992886.1 MFS transporter [Anaerolineae bacterium]
MNPLARQLRRAAGLSRNAKLFLVTVSVSALGNGIFMLLLNLFILARGNDKTFLGLLMSTTSLTALVLGLPMGIVVDRLGRKWAMVLGAALSVPGTLLLTLSPVDWPLLVAAALYGAGNALYIAAGPAFMAENATDDERPTLFSLQSGLSLLMGFLGSAVGGSLPALFGILLQVHPESVTAYRATLLAAEGVMALTLIPLLMIRERKIRPAGEHRPPSSLRDLPLRRDVVALLVPELIIALGAALLIPYLNVFFKERFRISDSLLGMTFAVSQLLMGGATLLAPILAERWGKIRTVVFTQLASLPFLFTLGFVPLLPVAIGAFWMRATLMNMAGPLYTAFAMERVRENERGTVGAMIGVAYSVGQSLGPGISGVIQSQFGFSPLFVTTGLTYLTASLLLLAFFGQAERPALRSESFPAGGK